MDNFWDLLLISPVPTVWMLTLPGIAGILRFGPFLNQKGLLNGRSPTEINGKFKNKK